MVLARRTRLPPKEAAPAGDRQGGRGDLHPYAGRIARGLGRPLYLLANSVVPNLSRAAQQFKLGKVARRIYWTYGERILLQLQLLSCPAICPQSPSKYLEID